MRVVTRKKIPLTLEIAPLIDIVLLLLIFFLLTSIGSQSMKLDLPEAKTAIGKTESLAIYIKSNGQIFVEENKVEIEALLPFLRSLLTERKDKTVLIRADAEVPFKIPVKVMDVCRLAGAEGVSIATKSSGEESLWENG